jgi:sulfatase modifying factor 1
MVRLLAALVFAGFSANAQVFTETFGIGTNQFGIDFVAIGSPGNPKESLGISGIEYQGGQVNYSYKMGKYEVSRGMVNYANSLGGLGITLGDLSGFGGNSDLKPANQISWNEAARFVNWLNISRGFSPAYKFSTQPGDAGYAVNSGFQNWNPSDNGYNSSNPYRNSNAAFFLPTIDEWYKSAFFNPNNNTYSDYPTKSNTAPTAVSGGTSGAVYSGPDFLGQDGPANIDNAGGLSWFGTMAQGGNVWEWQESTNQYFDGGYGEGDFRAVRGGGWASSASQLASTGASGSLSNAPNDDDEGFFGFRVAMVPEPSSLSLLLAGGAVLMAGRRRK